MTARLARGTPPFVAVLWLLPAVVRRLPPRTIAIAVAAAVTWFFRDPDRAPEGDGLVAAADGRVLSVAQDAAGRTTVSTYLNLLDVHVSNVRKKLGRDFIQTRRGLGYTIDA